MDKYIIREVAPECVDVSSVFDDDSIKAACGFDYQLFIITQEYGHYHGFNADSYQDIINKINDFIDDFTINRDPDETRKDIMQYYELKYSPVLCHKLTEYTNKVFYISDIDQVATFLSLTTGRRWNTATARGYCQRDYAKMLYCADIYTARDAAIYGDYYFGCCKEFSVTTLDENGAEIDTCYGYFVTDSEIENWRDSDQEYKRIVCSNAGIDINAATLELIDGSRTVTTYSYRAV